MRGQASLTSPVASSIGSGMMAPPPDLARRPLATTQYTAGQQRGRGWAEQPQWSAQPPPQYPGQSAHAYHNTYAPQPHAGAPGMPMKPTVSMGAQALPLPVAPAPDMAPRAAHMPAPHSAALPPAPAPQHAVSPHTHTAQFEVGHLVSSRAQYGLDHNTAEPAPASMRSSVPQAHPHSAPAVLATSAPPGLPGAPAQVLSVPVDIAAPARFDLVGQICGPGNSYIEHIERETGVRMSLVGGQAPGQGLSVNITQAEPWKRATAADLVRSLLQTVRAAAAAWSGHSAPTGHLAAPGGCSPGLQPTTHPSHPVKFQPPAVMMSHPGAPPGAPARDPATLAPQQGAGALWTPQKPPFQHVSAATPASWQATPGAEPLHTGPPGLLPAPHVAHGGAEWTSNHTAPHFTATSAPLQGGAAAAGMHEQHDATGRTATKPSKRKFREFKEDPVSRTEGSQVRDTRDRLASQSCLRELRQWVGPLHGRQ
jgi:hypothetical protein